MSDWLDELAIEAFNEHAMAGLAVGVVRGGGLERFVGLGLADAGANRPVAPDTIFRVGSISKTMTAVAVMQLVEEGRLGLDDPVGERLRSVRLEPREVTVRHLLTHTAGIGELRRWSDLARPVIGLASKVGERLPSAAEYYRRGLRAEVAPGSKWAYANHGFAALGALVEDLRGEPFAQVMRRRVFEPLGMAHSSFERDDRVAGRLAVGYGLRSARLKPVKDYEIVVGPAGACFSSTEDMARYVATLAGGGGPLLTPESLARMLEPDATVPGMGLAFFLDRVDGRRVAGHDGGWSGFVSALRRGIPLAAADPADELRFEARHDDWVVPVVFERGAGGNVDSLRSGSPRGGFLRLHRRPKAASLRLWFRGAAAGGVLGAAAAVRRARR